jgi:hypothetical protein
MSITLAAIYCRHWLKPTDLKLSFVFPHVIDGEHTCMHVRDTIHFNMLQNNCVDDYHKLITDTNQEEHSVETFRLLHDTFNPEQMPKIDVVFRADLGKYVVTDGVHRLSILVHKGIVTDSVPLKMLNITYDLASEQLIQNLLNSTTQYEQYNGWYNRIPYHGLHLGSSVFHGQRSIEQRLAKVRKEIDLTDLVVYDFGCNLGGNLLMAPEIRYGYGVDYDKQCINVATKLSKLLQYDTTYNFQVHDFDQDSYDKLRIKPKPNLIFLTSMGSWVKSWRELYQFCLNFRCPIVFETNNDKEGAPQLDFFKDCRIRKISDSSNDDTTGNHKRKLFIITPKVKVCMLGTYHHKNHDALLRSFQILNWEMVNFDDADVIFSANQYIDIENYPNKKFVFGPHFSVFPTEVVHKFNNVHSNAIYIQPSQQSVNSWQKEFGFTALPMRVYPFGIDTDLFQPSTETRDKVLLYFKNRDPKELKFTQELLQRKGIQYEMINYGSYREEHYQTILNRCKYAIWLGRHESQGYALEEALSRNIPLLVWNVRLRNQEYTMRHEYANVKSRVTAIPYWSDKCGMYFYEQEEFEPMLNKFLTKLDQFSPREYILDNLTMEKRADRLDTLIHS